MVVEVGMRMIVCILKTIEISIWTDEPSNRLSTLV